jgi:hypothetical protein
MTRMWAVEKYIGHWDGYSGVKEGANQPNNYYLYSTPQGLFRMLPWGTDETFQSDRHIAFDGRGSGILFGKCLDDELCAAAYWFSLNATVAAARGLNLAAKAAALDSLLAPWQMQEQANGRDPYPRSVAHGAALSAGEFATKRVGEAESWLAAHVPPGGDPGGGSGGGDSGGSGTGGSNGGAPSGSAPGTGVTPSDEAPAPRPRYLRPTREALRTMLTLATDATVAQSATFATADGPRTACVIRARLLKAGEVLLECRLRRSARQRLQAGALSLRLTTTVKSGDTTKTLHRKVVLAGA